MCDCICPSGAPCCVMQVISLRLHASKALFFKTQVYKWLVLFEEVCCMSKFLEYFNGGEGVKVAKYAFETCLICNSPLG